MAMNQGRVVNFLDTYGQIQCRHVPDEYQYTYKLWYLDAGGAVVGTPQNA